MYQKVVIAGYLGGDPEMRFTSDGRPVTNFSVATNRKWTGADGDLKEETTWFRVAAWGKQAETCNEYLSKGRLVLVEGRVKASAYVNKDGEAAASLELTASNVRFLGFGKNGGSDRGDSRKPAAASAPPPPDDDIPF